LQSTLTHVQPVPYLYIKVDGPTSISVEHCNGSPHVPRRNKKGDYEVMLVDLLSSLLFFKVPVLLQGPTGAGKSYVVREFLDAVFGHEGYYYVRLDRSLTGRSLMDPFLERKIIKKLPMTTIAKERCCRYGAIFIDEPNRGDSQDTLQVIDGTISLYGENSDLGLPIPGTNRLKSPFIVAAMNPSNDQYISTEKIDAAVENRLLRINYPAEPFNEQSTKLGNAARINTHVQFWNEIRLQTGLKGGWRDLFPSITDQFLFNKQVPDDVQEFIEIATSCLDPERTFPENEDIAGNFGFQFSFAFRDDDDFKRIKEARKLLGKFAFSNRDLVKLQNLARALALVRAYKKQLKDVIVSIEDTTVAFIMLLESKRSDEKGKPMLFSDIMRDIMRSYKQIRVELKMNNVYGLRPGILNAAVNFGKGRGHAALLRVIDSNTKRLNTPYTNIADATMRARLLADLLCLRDFCYGYKDQVDAALKLSDYDAVYRRMDKLFSTEGKLWAFDQMRLAAFFE
jgi:MoxR-like ATPase